MKKVSLRMTIACVMAFITIGAYAQNVTKNVTNETITTNTVTNQNEVVTKTYDLNLKSYSILNLWRDAKGEAQPIWITTHSKYGKKAGISGRKMILPGSSMTFKVGQIDSLLRMTGGEPARFICFSISVGSDAEFRDMEIPYAAKTIGIVRTSEEGEKFVYDESLITGGKAKKSYQTYLPNNYVVGNDEDAFFLLQNGSKYQVSLEDESFTTHTLPAGELVQLTGKDASTMNVKKGIWTVKVSFKDPNTNEPPVVKTLYLPIPKNGGTISIKDEYFQSATKTDSKGQVLVQYLLRNPTPFTVMVSGVKSNEKGMAGINDIVVINPGASKVVFVNYGVNHVTIVCADETGDEVNQTIMLVADWRSSGDLRYLGKTTRFRLTTN
ncbi:MAG: hypothetical protein WCK37_05260 [Candidatus Falkowbacteria bacterium]